MAVEVAQLLVDSQDTDVPDGPTCYEGCADTLPWMLQRIVAALKDKGSCQRRDIVATWEDKGSGDEGMAAALEDKGSDDKGSGRDETTGLQRCIMTTDFSGVGAAEMTLGILEVHVVNKRNSLEDGSVSISLILARFFLQ